MASQEDVRKIAMSLPGTAEGEDRFAFSVEVKGKHKGYLWTWAERVHPKKPKVINHGVIAVVVPSQTMKDILLDSDPNVYFTEPHYNGFLAVLVRLEAISVEELQPLIVEAWKCKAPTETVRAYEKLS
jgi:hypothetical protein